MITTLKEFKQFNKEIDNDENLEGKDGCLMLYFDIKNWKKIKSLVKIEDLHENGFSNNPHVTILYGLVGFQDQQQIIDLVKTFSKDIEVELDYISTFEKDEFDVIKFDIDNQLINDLNIKIKKFINSNDYPVYHPHLTIAYLKKGKGKDYVGEIEPITIKAKYYVYSLPLTNKKIKI